jgi:glycosyltransferase involved in cell wall biosynthesis
MTTRRRVTFVQTHPIQYMAPWFRYIAEHRPDVELMVLYGSTPTADQQGVGFGEAFSWDVALLEGYRYSVLSAPAAGRRFDSESFTGVDVGGLDEAIAATRPDVVVVPGWHSIYYVRAIAACRRAGIPVLYRGDSSLLSAPRGLKRYVWAVRTRIALSKFDGFLSVGTRIREYLRYFDIPDALVFDSPHAVDNEYFATASGHPLKSAERDTVRFELGAGPDDFLVLFAGKLIERKRPADVISAAARLGANVVVALAGNGELMTETRAAAQRAGVRVTWCGFLNQSGMSRVLPAADCVAVPSRWESWGLIVNEALASGTPCVVSDGVACAPDLMRDDVSGYVHAVGDVESLARALRRVRDASRGGLITRESCRAVAATHSFERATDGLLAATRRVHAQRRLSITANPGAPRILAAFGNMAIISGVERMSFEVLQTVRARGGAVHCIVNKWEGGHVVDRVDSIGATWSTGYYWYGLRRRGSLRGQLLMLWDICRTSADLLRDARRFAPTHVFAPEFHAVIRSAPALWLLRRFGVRVILRLGNAPEPGRFYGFLWRSVIDRCVDRFVPNSQFIHRELLAHGIAADKSRVVYNTVPHRNDSWEPRERIPGRIICVGQIIPPKGIDVLLDAFALMLRGGTNASLDIVGDMNGWEPPAFDGYRERIRLRAAAPELAGRVRLLGSREDVPALMAAASVHCQPSRPEQKEGFAVVALEAKRSGLPSVVTMSGALPEMVTHLVDGWVCPEVTPEAIAEGLSYFIADEARARHAGEHARNRERQYSHERFASAWAAAFDAEPSLDTAAVGVESL